MSDNVKQLPRRLDADFALESKDSYTQESWWAWEAMIKGGAVAKTETPATCIAKAAYGKLYGWDPVLSVNRICLVDGRPCLVAEGMLGLVRERMPRCVVVKVHHDRSRCVIKAKRDRDDEEWHICEFSMEDARHLSNKTNWKNYPKQMLYWRCASMLCRELFSDVTLGAHTPEELEESPVRVRQVGPQPLSFDDDAPVADAELVELDTTDPAQDDIDVMQSDEYDPTDKDAP